MLVISFPFQSFRGVPNLPSKEFEFLDLSLTWSQNISAAGVLFLYALQEIDQLLFGALAFKIIHMPNNEYIRTGIEVNALRCHQSFETSGV